MDKRDFIKVKRDNVFHANASVFVEAVVAERPELAAEDFYFVRSYPTVLIAGGEVHKRAKNLTDGAAAKALANEIRVHNFFRDQKIPVPEITYAGQASNFYSMEIFQDLTLMEAYHGLTKRQRYDAVRSLGECLATVPQVSLKADFDKSALKASPFDPILMDEIETVRRSEIVSIILKEHPGVSDVLQDYMTTLPQRPDVILHGDFFTHLNNAIIRERTGALTGIVDFGEACVSKAPEAEMNSVINAHFAEDLEMQHAFKEGFFRADPRAAKNYACLSFIKVAAYAEKHIDSKVGQTIYLAKFAIPEMKQAIKNLSL